LIEFYMILGYKTNYMYSCEKYQVHRPEASYSINLGLETPPTPGSTLRTPLRKLSTNLVSPTPRRTVAKTPGTAMFDAKLQAIRDTRIKTPDFSSLQIVSDDLENMPSPDSQPTPLMLKTCPAKQVNQPLFVTDEAAEIRKKLFRGVRKSIAAPFMMKWDEE
jgi:hypothetical protein